MSVAAASFLNNSWDIPIRRTGFSLLMSQEMSVPPQFHPNQQQQHRQEEEEQAQIQRDHHGHTGSPIEGMPRNCMPTHSPSLAGGSSLLSPPWNGTHQSTHFNQHPNMDQESFLFQLQQQQQQQQHDSGILQKFSALSVRISQSSSGHPCAGPVQLSCGARSEPVSPGNSAMVPPQGLFCQNQRLMRSRSNNTSGCGHTNTVGVSASSSLSAASTVSGVFASLDSVDEHSPPNSPEDTAIPALFNNTRASSFPTYGGRASASTNALCCCSAGVVCSMCKGLPFPQPIRSSVSHPNPTRQLSQPTVSVSGMPCVLPPREREGSATSPTGNSWFFYSQSLSAAHSVGHAAPSQGRDAMSELGWDILQQQSMHHSTPLSALPTNAMPHGLATGPTLGVSPSPPMFSDSRQTGAQPGPSTAAGLERDLANHWGFGLQSMDSSSLSLSQDCSDSLGGGEINSGVSRDQEADSGPSLVISCEAVAASVCASPPHGRLHAPLPPTPPTAPRCAQGSQGARGASPPVPRSASSPKTPLVSGSSPASPSIGLRRGLSSYFGGKSRSFTSLADVSSIQSIQELAKPVRNYVRRKRMGSGGKEASSGSGMDAMRRQALGIGKEPKGLFKKGGSSRHSLEFQAGLAVAVAMGDVDVDVSSSRDMLGAFSLEREHEEEEEGMETVMEEAGEGLEEGSQQQQE